MCNYYRGMICGKTIESEKESDLLRLASRIANKNPSKREFLFFDYVCVADDMTESTPLPQQYYTRLMGRNWEFQGNAPEELKVVITP